MTTAKVVVMVPLLRRPHRIAPLVASLEAGTPEPHRLILIATAGDTDVIVAARAAAAELDHVSVEVLPRNPRGDYAKKINHAVRVSEEPFIFAGADDLHFHPGWLPAGLAAFANPAIGVVGTQDLCNPRTIAGEHSTHLFFRRSYIDELGTVDEPGLAFHEGYAHEYVDDEAVETAKMRGAWSFAGDSVVEHLHPMVGKARSDALYSAQAPRMRLGRKVFDARRALWRIPPPRPSHDNVAVVIATFGEDSWPELARKRAEPSAKREHPAELVLVHAETLCAARNAGARQTSAEWLCFLDADDELEPGYIDAMAATRSGDILAPAVRYVIDDDLESEPVSFTDRDIRRINPCVIGTLITRNMFLDVGGFWPEPAYEDWSLFRRAVLAGGELEHVPDAIYRAHENRESRNKTVSNPAGLMRQIVATHNQWLRRRKARAR